MLLRFQTTLKHNNWQSKKIILALSGGADSMVMAGLFYLTSEHLVIAHCNYGLRGEESEGDEQLVEAWAKVNNIPFYKKDFQLGTLLKNEGGNLQETARKLRYEWFESLRLSLDFDLIATAHHQQDSIETLLINFFKGTGLSGMHGILPQNGKIIRPMLSFKKEEILRYAEDNSIPWRMDSSNKKDDYARNKIRNQVLPLVSEIFPAVYGNLAGNIQRFQEIELLYRQSVEKYRKKLMEQRNNDWYISVLKLRNCRPVATILYELLKPFGFQSAQLPHLLHLQDAETGKMISSPSHRIIKNRGFLIITPLPTEESTFILIENGSEPASIPFADFVLEKRTKTIQPDQTEAQVIAAQGNDACFDLDSIDFPLYLRPWKQGDYFYPLGMGGKKKKVSRFLTDRKIPIHEKEKVWVLESNKRILWVLGMRIDERFKITRKTKHILCLSMVGKSAGSIVYQA